MSQKNKFQIDPIQLFSHELKTPLSSLKLSLNLLKKNHASHPKLDLIELMEHEVNHMIHFISHQLDAKFLENQKNLMDFAWFSWDKLLQETLKSFYKMAEQKHIKIQVKSLDSLEVFGDFLWLGQALKNLLFNSLQYAPDHSIIILSCQCKDKGLQIDIKNNKQEKSQKPLFKPQGLGLKITQMIADHHKGTLKFLTSSRQEFCVSLFIPQARLDQKSA